MGKCGVNGCMKEATKLVRYMGGWVSACDEHAGALEKEMEEIEEKMKKTKEQKEKAIKEAKKLLTFGLDEVPFVIKEYDGRPDTYITLGRKVPYEVYKLLIESKAMVKERDGENGNMYYVIKDEERAAQILQKHGFKVVTSEEWKLRHKRACEILEQAGIPLSSVPFI
jgi:CO dehydrogenase/acetyl-CoA synthase gamma subunit (corrinoid Fe-S protein)